MPAVKGRWYVTMYGSSDQSHKDTVNTSDVTASAYGRKMPSTCPRSRAWPTQSAPITGKRRKFISVIVKEGGCGRHSHVGQKPWGEMPSEERCTLYTYGQHVHSNTSANVRNLTSAILIHEGWQHRNSSIHKAMSFKDDIFIEKISSVEETG